MPKGIAQPSWNFCPSAPFWRPTDASLLPVLLLLSLPLWYRTRSNSIIVLFRIISSVQTHCLYCHFRLILVIASKLAIMYSPVVSFIEEPFDIITLNTKSADSTIPPTTTIFQLFDLLHAVPPALQKYYIPFFHQQKYCTSLVGCTCNWFELN